MNGGKVLHLIIFIKEKGDGEDLSKLSDDTIWEKLKDRIYDSSVTVIFISPEMKEVWKEEKGSMDSMGNFVFI